MNELAVTRVRGREVELPADPGPALEGALARAGWSPSPGAAGPVRLSGEDAARLAEAAAELRPILGGGPDAVAALNRVLIRHRAVPSLHGDPPVLAFHAPDATLADAWAANAATALAMVIGVGQGVRLRSCEADGCELVFFDVTRNASRRFCGLSCQNRAKATAYRARRRNP